MKLNEKLLNLIVMVQSYKRNIISQNLFYRSIDKKELEKDWYEETKKYYNSIGDTVLNPIGLSTNINSFERILAYKVTDEMESTQSDDLGKFTF